MIKCTSVDKIRTRGVCVCRVRHGRDISNYCINSVTIKFRDCNRANAPEILRFSNIS